MAYSDACVVPYPAGDTSARRFALEAGHMGFSGIVCDGGELSGVFHGVSIYKGLFLKDVAQNRISQSIRRCGFKPDLVLVGAKDASFNRAALSTGGVDVLRGIQDAGKRAFDDVCGMKAVENYVAIDIDLSAIICRRGPARQKALESFSSIVKFQRKFGFMLSISSGASSYIDMRSPSEIAGLCGLFGMEKEETLEALGSVDRIVNRRPVVEVIGE